MAYEEPEPQHLNTVRIYRNTNDLLTLIGQGEPYVRAQGALARELLANKGIHVSLLVYPEQENYIFSGQVYKTRELPELPIIVRDGVSPPWMDARSLGLPGDRITSQVLLRTGSAFFRKHSLIAEALDLLKLLLLPANSRYLTQAQKKTLKGFQTHLEGATSFTQKEVMDAVKGIGSKSREIKIRDKVGATEAIQLLEALGKFEDADHFTFFDELINATMTSHPEWSVVQGLGDLTMNAWNVAYFPTEPEPGRWILSPPGEPLLDRTYTCLALIPGSKPHDEQSWLNGGLHIDRFRFSRSRPYAFYADNDEAVGKRARFAVYGKAVIWNGRLVEPHENIDEWSDVRHVFALPNLNPDDDDATKGALRAKLRKTWGKGSGVHPKSWAESPRMLFGQLTSEDVWLFEKQLLEDANLRRLACLGPITLDREELPAPPAWINCCLDSSNYHEVDVGATGRLKPGEFFWQKGVHEQLHVYLQRNRYPCSMIGIGRLTHGEHKGKNALFSLAIGGATFNRSAYTIWDYARVLMDMGCRRALVIDEGSDVFQALFKDSGAIETFVQDPNLEADFMRVPRRRQRLRACLSLWQQEVY